MVSAKNHHLVNSHSLKRSHMSCYWKILFMSWEWIKYRRNFHLANANAWGLSLILNSGQIWTRLDLTAFSMVPNCTRLDRSNCNARVSQAHLGDICPCKESSDTVHADVLFQDDIAQFNSSYGPSSEVIGWHTSSTWAVPLQKRLLAWTFGLQETASDNGQTHCHQKLVVCC